MGEYINTPAYANQISKKQINKNGNAFHFVKLNAPDTINSQMIKEKYGNVKSISIMVPEYAIKGAVVAKENGKYYNLDKNQDGKPIDFEPLVIDENGKKVEGKHILATISLKLPEDEKELNDDSKVNVTLSVLNEETKEYENKHMTTSFKKLSEDLFKQNTIAVTQSIKQYKDKAKDIFNEVDFVQNIEDNEIDYELLTDEPELTR